MLEKELEKKFTEAVKKCGGIAFKFVSFLLRQLSGVNL